MCSRGQTAHLLSKTQFTVLALLYLPILNYYITNFYWIQISSVLKDPPLITWAHTWKSFEYVVLIFLFWDTAKSFKVVFSVSAVSSNKRGSALLTGCWVIFWGVQHEGIQISFEKNRISVFRIVLDFMFLWREWLKEFRKLFIEIEINYYLLKKNFFLKNCMS